MSIIRRLLSNTKYLLNHNLRGDIRALQNGNNCLFRSQFYEVNQWFSGARDSCRGQRCFLLGCGPSLNSVDLQKLKGQKVMGVNGSALIDGLDLDYFVTVSQFFWKSHQQALSELKCRRFLPYYLEDCLKSEEPTVWLNSIDDKEYRILHVEKPWKFSHHPEEFIFLGGTVIFVCLQILYYLGYEEVVVLGLDHDYGIDRSDVPKEGKYVSSDTLTAHFKKDYYRKGEQVHIDIHGMERAYELAQQAFRADGRRILNASPGTKLETFERIEFDALF
jgi:hypothetical protein